MCPSACRISGTAFKASLKTACLIIPEVVTIIDPTVEQLTSLYEVSFSGANMQRFNLGDRMFQIQQGMTGFVSPITPVPPPAPTGKEINEGKGGEGKAPPPLPCSQDQPIAGESGRMAGAISFISTTLAAIISRLVACLRELIISSPTISPLAYSADIPTPGLILPRPGARPLTLAAVVSTRPTLTKVGG
jgi:hypothetical protein